MFAGLSEYENAPTPVLANCVSYDDVLLSVLSLAEYAVSIFLPNTSA